MFLEHSLIIYFQKQAAKAPVFGTELAKLLSDTGDEGSNPATFLLSMMQMMMRIPTIIILARHEMQGVDKEAATLHLHFLRISTETIPHLVNI